MPTLHFHALPDWPPLAWVAECRRDPQHVVIHHGPRVEVRDTWFAEAVWEGNFEAGDFDQVDHVFGSGARLREGRVTFVSSAATVDRLQWLARGETTFVSNSLACLLAAAGDTLDPETPDFPHRVRTIMRGLDAYERTLPTRAGNVHLTYHANLTFDGVTLHEVPKPFPIRDFATFASYHAFLRDSLTRLVQNLESPARHHRYDLLGTLSSGYDSTTVAVLMRPLGLKEVLSCRNARNGHQDDGATAAAVLGLRTIAFARDEWRQHPLCEVPFLAGDAKGDDLFLRSAEGYLAGRVLLTGYHGDKVWDKETKSAYLGTDLRRGDHSGVSLTEYRLHVGFLHLPVPFLGARQIGDLHVLSRSREMAPWDFPHGYSRPICRRIIEMAGVPRDAFGIQKRAATVALHTIGSDFTPESEADFSKWLRQHGQSVALRRILRAAAKPYHFINRRVEAGIRLTPGRCWPLLEKLTGPWKQLNPSRTIARHEFAWAVDRLIQSLPSTNR